MVNLRSKAKSVAPNIALKREATDPTLPYTVSDNSNLSEATLRKLPRAELQKLAMVHKVKANIKSELIIQQLLSFQRSKKSRPAEDDPEEGPSRKRFKNEAASEGVSIPQDQVELPTTGPGTDVPAQASVEDPQPPEAGPSAPQSIPTQTKPIELSYDKDLFSGTESEMTEEEQLDFTTPVSSRSGTPPAANVVNLEHCVAVMRQISAQDETLLKGVTDVRDTAAKLRKRARDVRDLVKAEKGRRERMETYFRYWQEIEPRWDREWLYGEKMVPDHKINHDDSDEPDGPPTVPVRHNRGAQNGERRERPAMQKPALSPEELKRRREEIISKQEAEQRELEALRRNGDFFRSESSEAAESLRDLGEGGSSSNDPAPLFKNDVSRSLMTSLENSGEVIGSAVVTTSS